MDTGRKKRKGEKERKGRRREEESERLQKKTQDLDFNQLKTSC